jgi:hypothetical protein
MSNEPLRGCPTCGTKVTDVALGLRDYRWVSDKLPGRVAPMDIDFMLERNGHILIIEFKPAGVEAPTGQARTLRTLRQFADVWVVQGDGPIVTVNYGDGGKFKVSVEDLADEVALWFEEAGA